MDTYGMCVDALYESGADLAYVMPSHQFPTGIVMPIGRRLELLKWAAGEPGRYLIEDDYDSEFRYRGKPIPSLQASDQADQVIYIFQSHCPGHTNQLYGAAPSSAGALPGAVSVFFLHSFPNRSVYIECIYPGWRI